MNQEILNRLQDRLTNLERENKELNEKVDKHYKIMTDFINIVRNYWKVLSKL